MTRPTSKLIGNDGNHNGDIATVRSDIKTNVPRREKQQQHPLRQRQQQTRPRNLVFIVGLAVSVVSTITWIVISSLQSAFPKDQAILLLYEQLFRSGNDNNKNNNNNLLVVQNSNQEDGDIILRPFGGHPTNSNQQRNILMQEEKQLRNCTNPEYWFHDDETNKQQHDDDSSSSFESVFQTCPLSPFSEKDVRFQQFDNYFHQMVQVLDENYRSVCQSEIMVFGMALGNSHFKYIRNRNRIISKCQVWIILESSLHKKKKKKTAKIKNLVESSIHPSYKKSAPWWFQTDKGDQLLVVQQSGFSPFRNLRRTVKLFKMNPHKLFPWTQRFLWVDAKLEFPAKYQNQSGVDWYFNRTIGNQPPPRGSSTKDKNNNNNNNTWSRWNRQPPPSNNVCGTVISIPHHKSAMHDVRAMSSVRYVGAFGAPAGQAAARVKPTWRRSGKVKPTWCRFGNLREIKKYVR